LRFIVTEGKFERSGQVNPEEDTILEGLEGFEIDVSEGSVVGNGLEDGAICHTSLIVFSISEIVVDGSPVKVPVSEMSLIIHVVQEVFESLVECVNSHNLEEVLVVLAVEDALKRVVEGGIQGNDFSGIDLSVGVVSSRESTSEVVESLEILEIVLSGDVVPAFNGIGLGEIERSPETIVIIVQIKDGTVDCGGISGGLS